MDNEDGNMQYIPKHSHSANNKIKKQVVVKRKKRTIRIKWIIVLLIIFIGIILYSLYKIFNWGVDNKRTSDITKKIEENISVVEVEDNFNTEIINEEEDKSNPYWYYITFPLIDVDITELKNQNSDTVGFININNTNINYPFVHTSDNEFYLNHSFDKSYNDAGWLFLDYRNNIDLNDRNIIRISLDNVNTLWQIFSVYKIEVETYYITTNFNSDDDYLKVLNTSQS